MEIVLATSNENKVREINKMIEGYNIKFILPPEGFDPVENGTTFEENSYIKAQAAWEISHNWVLADDSGLCIKALDGGPGIYSARYAETPQKRIDRVLVEMEGKTDRYAEFRCAMTLINPEGKKVYSHTGICEGSIVEKQRGTNGFGYDPIFLLKISDKTMAELTDDEKNQVSHRSKALKSVLEFLSSTQNNA